MLLQFLEFFLRLFFSLLFTFSRREDSNQTSLTVDEHTKRFRILKFTRFLLEFIKIRLNIFIRSRILTSIHMRRKANLFTFEIRHLPAKSTERASTRTACNTRSEWWTSRAALGSGRAKLEKAVEFAHRRCENG